MLRHVKRGKWCVKYWAEQRSFGTMKMELGGLKMEKTGRRADAKKENRGADDLSIDHSP